VNTGAHTASLRSEVLSISQMVQLYTSETLRRNWRTQTIWTPIYEVTQVILIATQMKSTACLLRFLSLFDAFIKTGRPKLSPNYHSLAQIDNTEDERQSSASSLISGDSVQGVPYATSHMTRKNYNRDIRSRVTRQEGARENDWKCLRCTSLISIFFTNA
jgi:hypothetical protein